ncbi:hypothetical protein V6N13_007807 [Hibiscus sabdariffa]|uniref:Uncharacterized protein n=1 Tax=Hibiscus sabdariffa TaxID=183260 RepID=A0ABR2EML7_9ROSI
MLLTEGKIFRRSDGTPSLPSTVDSPTPDAFEASIRIPVVYDPSLPGLRLFPRSVSIYRNYVNHVCFPFIEAWVSKEAGNDILGLFGQGLLCGKIHNLCTID